jgi:two-component system cell cycle sensor histidine kinase/response regulator CckA
MPRRSPQPTVLVVDDEPPVLRLLRRQLEALGWTVLEARNGPEALRLLQGRRGAVDLVLSDIVMPGMNGTELADRILADRPEQCVVLMSGQAPGGLARVGRRDKIVPVLRKPFTPEQLFELITFILQQHEPVLPAQQMANPAPSAPYGGSVTR